MLDSADCFACTVQSICWYVVGLDKLKSERNVHIYYVLLPVCAVFNLQDAHRANLHVESTSVESTSNHALRLRRTI